MGYLIFLHSLHHALLFNTIPIILFQIEDAESYLGVMEKIGILANIGVGAITFFYCFGITFFDQPSTFSNSNEFCSPILQALTSDSWHLFLLLIVFYILIPIELMKLFWDMILIDTGMSPIGGMDKEQFLPFQRAVVRICLSIISIVSDDFRRYDVSFPRDDLR